MIKNDADLAAHFAADMVTDDDGDIDEGDDEMAALDDLKAERDAAWTELEKARLDFWCWSASIADAVVEQGREPAEETAVKWRKARAAYEAAGARHTAACDRCDEARAAADAERRAARETSGAGAMVPAPAPA